MYCGETGANRTMESMLISDILVQFILSGFMLRMFQSVSSCISVARSHGENSVQQYLQLFNVPEISEYVHNHGCHNNIKRKQMSVPNSYQFPGSILICIIQYKIGIQSMFESRIAGALYLQTHVFSRQAMYLLRDEWLCTCVVTKSNVRFN